MSVEILTKQNSLENLVAPNGRKFRIIQHPIHPNLYCIAYEEGISGALPEHLTATVFTKEDLARKYLLRFLEKLWDESDAIAERNKSRRAA